MQSERRYIQTELSLALNKDIISRAYKFLSWRRSERGLTVTLAFTDRETDRIVDAPSLEDLTTSYGVVEADDIPITAKIDVVFSVVLPGVIRVTVNPHTDPFADMFITEPSESCEWNVEEAEDEIILSTDSVTLRYLKARHRYSIEDKAGRIILREANDEKSVYFGYFSPPLGRIRQGGQEFFCQSFHHAFDEDYYGFGEQFTDFNKRHQRVEIWNMDPGNTMSFMSYKNIPFFISTKGYGLLLNTPRKSIFDMGTKTGNAFSIQVAAEGLDYYIIVDPSLKNILRRRSGLSGCGCPVGITSATKT